MVAVVQMVRALTQVVAVEALFIRVRTAATAADRLAAAVVAAVGQVSVEVVAGGR
jgi:succinyl-CoA synthetase beta subunit